MTIQIEPSLATALASARRAHQAAATLIGGAGLKRDPVAITQACLLATIVDGLAAVIALITSPGQAHADTVNRSLIEALGDLHHLCADPGFYDQLKLTSALRQKAAAQSFIERRLNDPATILQQGLAMREAREQSKIIDELEAKGVKPVGPSIRIEAPELSEDLVGVYSLHSFAAHHDLTALSKRHFRGEHLVFGNTLSTANAANSLRVAVVTTANALMKAEDFLSVESQRIWETVGALHAEIEALAGVFDSETAAERKRLEAEVARGKGSAKGVA